jgi:acetoacetate decarboxylase
MPVQAPLYPPPPYDYEVELVQILFRARPEALLGVVPEPLEPDPENMVSCVVARYPRVSRLGPYHESFFLVGVNYKGRFGTYCPYMWVSTDSALAAGREVWGFPKKLAKMELTVTGEVARGVVERGGYRIIDAAVYTAGEGKLEHILFADIFFLKVIPSVDGVTPPELRLASVSMENLMLEGLQGGPCTLSFEPSPSDPTYLLEPTEIIGGVYCRGSWTLPYGETLEILK